MREHAVRPGPEAMPRGGKTFAEAADAEPETHCVIGIGATICPCSNFTSPTFPPLPPLPPPTSFLGASTFVDPSPVAETLIQW